MKSPDPSIPESELSGFVDSTRSLIEEAPQMDESNTKVKIVQPFLQQVLGYELEDIELEYKVQMGGQIHRVDYALVFNDIPEVFVEAKGLDTSISSKDVDQLKSYLKLQDVSWGLLTNGEQYNLYQLEIQDRQAEFHLLAELSVDELLSHRRTLSAISKGAIERGEAEDVVRYIKEVNRAKSRLDAEKSAIAEAVADTVTEMTSDVIYQDVEQEAKELVDRLIDHLRADKPSGVDTPTTQTGDTSSMVDTFPAPDADESMFPVRSRSELPGGDDSLVALYASQERGVEFLTKWGAWGFIRIADEPEYFMIYLSKPYQHVRYVGVVERLTPGPEWAAANGVTEDEYEFEENKKVIEFSELYRLEDPIPIGPDNPHRMQGLLHTTLGAVKRAETTDDL